MIREDLSHLPSYQPGKKQVGKLKLSSNEISEGPLPGVVDAIRQTVAECNRYPDMASIELREALAAHLGLSADQVAVGTGSSALCQQLVQITCSPGDEVIYAWRSFEAYPIFTKIVGATAVEIPLNHAHAHDLNAMAEAISERTRLIFVCNPNNPTGTTITEAEFRDFMAKVPSNVLVALDEAYFEYNRQPDGPNAAELIQEFPNLVGLRTFSKAYGLAGLRVGYAFGAARIAEALNKVAIPFGINVTAQAGAVASLAIKDELLARTEEVVAERERVAKHIAGVPSQANFVWLPTEHAAALGAALNDAGAITRVFPEGVRVTIGTRAEMDRFLDMWDRVAEPPH
ncbi:histidinol-phosphate transaminase [Staphylococcus chromogenes]|nr:histidinol-phosphate transaminase [Staphylococcus chromogenes]